MMFWAMIEMSIAIVAGCLPAIWPLISQMSLKSLEVSARRITPKKGHWLSLRKLPPGRIKPEPNDRLDREPEASGPYLQLMNHDRSNPTAHQYSPSLTTDIPLSMVPASANASP